MKEKVGTHYTVKSNLNDCLPVDQKYGYVKGIFFELNLVK